MKAVRYFILVCVFASFCLPLGAGENSEEMVYSSRNEVPEAYRWNLRDIFKDTGAWEKAARRVEEQLPVLASFEGHLGESPDKLADALQLKFSIEKMAQDVLVYAAQWQTTDRLDAKANEYQSRAESLEAGINQTSSFIQAELAEFPEEKLQEFMKSSRLGQYRHLIDNMTRLRPHIRSAEVEKVLAGSALLQGAPVQIYQSMVSADIQWPEIEAQGNAESEEKTKVIPALFYKFMGNQDRDFRKDAALALFGTYEQYGHTLAGTYAASVNKDVWLARTRHYDSSLAMVLDRSKVPPSVVETLVSVVHENLDAVHQYVELRRKVLRLDDFHIYDLYVGMVPSAEKHYSFDEGWDMAMSYWKDTMGEEYAAVARRARDEHWIDIYPNTGKQGGAYSWGSYNSHPYLFLNWGGTLEDVFTLVHEMGHSIHTYLSNSNQPFHDSDYSLFVAEVASVASESLFFEWLLDRTEDPQERLALLNLRMNNITGTFLRQIFFHEFEAAAHRAAEEGKPLTKDALDEIWGTLWQEYYGPDATLDPQYRSGWERIPHFYRTFYVWVYATSFAAGESVAERFRSGDPDAVNDYLAALKLGNSVYPMDALKRAGIDMNDPKVIGNVMDRYREILAEMEKLLVTE